jgi:hypothetical protein
MLLEFRDARNTWSYIWGSEHFQPSRAYKVMIGTKITPPRFNWIWSSSCQPKHKVFFWMLLHDKVNFRNLLGRKQFYLDSYNCATTDCQIDETLHDLFWSFPFAERCWEFVCPTRRTNLSVLEAVQDLKTKLAIPFYMEIIIFAAWAIWITRNNNIFKQIAPAFQRWRESYFLELSLLRHRIKRRYANAFITWLDSQL